MEDVTPNITEISALGDNGSNENLLEQLAAKRRVLSETKETFLPVPGYDREPPLLLARYRLLEGPELSRIGDKVSRETRNQWQRSLLAAIDTFIAAITGFWIDKGDGTPPVPMTHKGQPITGFNSDLAEALRFDDKIQDPNVHRQVVSGLFADNDAAISKHNFQLNRWFTDTSLDVSTDFMGSL